MASIEERNGSFRVNIRKKGVEITRTFKERHTAELWALWKEDLIDNMNAFDVKVERTLTLADAIGLKTQELIDKGSIEIQDIHNINEVFKPFISKFLYEITLNDYNEHCRLMLSSEVIRGGKKGVEGTGKKVIQSPQTVLRKFVILASVYSYLIKKGFDIENHPQKVVTQLRESLKK